MIEAAESYDKAHTAHSKARGKLNTAKDNLIAVMKETGTIRCLIRNGAKFVRLEERDQVKIEKPTSDPED